MIKRLLLIVILGVGFAYGNAKAEDVGIVVLKSLTQLHRTQVNILKREGDYHLKIARQHMEAARVLDSQSKTPQRDKQLAAELSIAQQHLEVLKKIEQDILANTTSVEALTKELNRLLPKQAM